MISRKQLAQPTLITSPLPFPPNPHKYASQDKPAHRVPIPSQRHPTNDHVKPLPKTARDHRILTLSAHDQGMQQDAPLQFPQAKTPTTMPSPSHRARTCVQARMQSVGPNFYAVRPCSRIEHSATTQATRKACSRSRHFLHRP